MKSILPVLLALCLTPAGARAQWLTKTYPLVSGWNGIWLAGDASHTPLSQLITAYPEITEVWRWNPNPDQIEFSQTPSSPTTNSEEWTVWKRDVPEEQQLTGLLPNSSYLIRCASPVTLSLKQKAVPPSAAWLISGANFLGFPSAGSGASAPTLSSYLASFPSASTTVLAPTTKIYKYIGGELGPGNPLQVAPGSETLSAGRAYWFNVATVSDFTGPVEYELPSTAGLSFGRTGSTITVGVMNRSTSSLTLSVSLQGSEPAPDNQQGVTGGVPLTRRVFNTSTNSYDETAVDSGFAVTVAASGRLNLEFGINRGAMAGQPDDFYASILRIRDSANLSDVLLPVSAQTSSPAGLWICQASVTNVVSTVPGANGSGTSRPFPLVFLMHMDGSGTARLLSQVYLGKLTLAGNPLGICISEDRVLGYNDSDVKPQRFLAPQMPRVPYINGTGSFAAETTSRWTITVPFDDPTNPFVHTYHPDHDNLSARLEPLGNKAESYTITRTCDFKFTSSPPDGSTITGWGSTILGGTYAETLKGLNKSDLSTSGTFVMRRVSEIADIDLTSP